MNEDDNARACKLSHACIMLEIIDCYIVHLLCLNPKKGHEQVEKTLEMKKNGVGMAK